MSEVNQNAAVETNEPAVIVSYTVTRYENGDIKVENNPVEGATALNTEALYKDVEDVADTIKNRRLENAAYRGIYRFYAEMEQREIEAQQAAALAEVDPTV